MLLGVGLPESYWGEVVATTTYLINKCSSTRIKFKTHMEDLSGKLVNYSNFKILELWRLLISNKTDLMLRL